MLTLGIAVFFSLFWKSGTADILFFAADMFDGDRCLMCLVTNFNHVGSSLNMSEWD